MRVAKQRQQLIAPIGAASERIPPSEVPEPTSPARLWESRSARRNEGKGPNTPGRGASTRSNSARGCVSRGLSPLSATLPRRGKFGGIVSPAHVGRCQAHRAATRIPQDGASSTRPFAHAAKFCSIDESLLFVGGADGTAWASVTRSAGLGTGLGRAQAGSQQMGSAAEGSLAPWSSCVRCLDGQTHATPAFHLAAEGLLLGPPRPKRQQAGGGGRRSGDWSLKEDEERASPVASRCHASI